MKQLKIMKYLHLKKVLRSIESEDSKSQHMNIQVDSSPDNIPNSPTLQSKFERLSKHLNNLEDKGEIN